jgi:AcrR family transcriptional regulator
VVVRIAADDVQDRQISDLTARARIRDAAVACFAQDGFDTPFRTIAARAAVSPGLITHHFRSKAALRAECDAEVLRQYRALKAAEVAEPTNALLARLSSPGQSATLLVYLLRAIHSGGEGARAFLEHLIDDMRPVMAQAVDAGLVRPSRDEEARLRYLTHQSMGALLVLFLTTPDATPERFVASLHEGDHETVLPMLELFTEGFLADRGPLEAHIGRLHAPGDPAGHTGGSTATATGPQSPFTTKE